MSVLKSGLYKAGLAIGASALIAGAAAGPAFAAGTTISGGGASLQQEVQNAWLTDWKTKSALTGISSSIYTGSSSGTGLRNFGLVDSSPALGSPLLSYIGTDDPPSGLQIRSSASVTGAPAGRTLNAITIPVTQAPVAVLVSLPAGISGPTGTLDISNALLEQVFSATVPTSGGFPANSWGAFLTLAGETGLTGTTPLNSTISLQARSSTSGTTYAFKNYLTKIDSATWNPFNNGNVDWPTGETPSATPAAGVVATGYCGPLVPGPPIDWSRGYRNPNSSGQILASQVAADDDGAISYANLADAVGAGFTGSLTSATGTLCGAASGSHQIAFARVQNNGIGGSPVYASPLTGTSTANVRTDRIDWTDSSGAPPARYPGLTDSWLDAGITGNNPAVGTQGVTPRYGLVAATYMVVWDDYGTTQLQRGYGTSFQDIEDTACNYARYVVSQSPFAANGGQTLLLRTATNARYYGPLPTNVLTVAQAAARECG